MDYTFATLIVAAEYRQAAQELLSDQYFLTGLSADGLPPATHYVSAGPFDNSELNKALNQQAVPFWVSFGPEPDFNGMQIVQAPSNIV
jgi:hypothetical protein